MEVEPQGLLRINPEDAKKAGVADGEMLQLNNGQGKVTGKVVVTTDVPQGLIFAPNNFTELGAMQLVPDGSNRASVQAAKA